MSWGTCYSGSNNIHFDYPPLMSDGRNYVNYDPACDFNRKLIKQNNIQSNFQYRQFLIQNANKIREQSTIQACDNCGVCDYGYPLQKSPRGKYIYKHCNDFSQPYGYENSDLKNIYLSRQALQSRMVAPLMSQQGYVSLPNAN